jgi:DNA-binding GntR family transcriptional regulator
MQKIELWNDVEQAILDAIFSLRLRANEVFNPTIVEARVQRGGAGAEQFHDALASLEKRGLIASVRKRRSIAHPMRPKFVRLTTVGFENL